MGFIAAIRIALQNYASFKGRASRQEFAWTLLLGAGVWVLAWLLARLGVINLLTGGALVVVLAVGALGLTVRRLHDAGRRGWWLLPAVAPLALAAVLSQSRGAPPGDLGTLYLLAGLGGLLLLAALALPATPGENAYGADPRVAGLPVFQPLLGPLAGIGQALRRGLRLRGRACRAEMMWFNLFQAMAIVLGFRLAGLFGLDETSHLALMAVLLVPAFSLAVRRLHDMGRGGWWAVPSYVLTAFMLVLASEPRAGFTLMVLEFPVWFATTALFAALLFPGTAGDNAYGPPEGVSPAAPS